MITYCCVAYTTISVALIKDNLPFGTSSEKCPLTLCSSDLCHPLESSSLYMIWLEILFVHLTKDFQVCAELDFSLAPSECVIGRLMFKSIQTSWAQTDGNVSHFLSLLHLPELSHVGI